MYLITDWFKRTFSDPQIIALLVILFGGFAVILFMGDMLAPVLASIVIAYLLEGLVAIGERRGLPRFPAVVVVYGMFLILVTLMVFGLLPLLSKQISQLANQLPQMIFTGQDALMALPERYPTIISVEQLQQVTETIRGEIIQYGQQLLSLSLSSLVGVITIMVYLILMPLLVFFFLKDKHEILDWFIQFLPEARMFASKVWKEVDCQIANYVRGKFQEVIIVWAASLVTFSFLELQYAMLLSVLVGLSVIVPYVGATVVTLPVLLVAWFQWGWSGDFIWLSVAYLIIQALDGNVIVPLLFSEVVDLHPVAIIVAILVFGGFWGFWGVFFAIPLATLFNAILRAWPTRRSAQAVAAE